MTRIETSRVREVLGISIGKVQEAAYRLNANSELQVLEADIAALERTISELKSSLASLPYQHPQ